jgi:hypothetical protein
MNAAQLLNPKAFAKAKKTAPKKTPNYGTLLGFPCAYLQLKGTWVLR